MAIETLKMKLTGVSPLLMHNGQLADPTNKFTKALKTVTKKRTKTDEDHLEMRRIEWLGGLYMNDQGQIGLPADVVLGLVITGAKKSKHGQDAKAGVYEKAPFFKLEYDGPANAEELYKDSRFSDYRGVRVGTSRVMRCRPIFRQWAVTFALAVESEIIDMKSVIEAIEAAGEKVGLGDYRPRFGRFEAAVVK